MIRRLVIRATLDSFRGYGRIVNNLTVELVKLGIDVVIYPTIVVEMFGSKVPVEVKSRVVNRIQPDDFMLIIDPPLSPPTPNKITGYFTMFEATRLRELSLDYLNLSELIVTPSHWNSATFSAQGVVPPISVVPLGCEPSYEPYPRRDKFIFAAAGRMAHGGTRKGVETVIDCFKSAFTDGEDDVRLHLKIFPDCKLPDPNDSRISVTRAYLTESQMHRWMADANVFVSAAKGEGWGLHQHEALATGRPCISPLHGGLLEFANRHSCFPVKFRHVPADGFYEGLGNLIEIDEVSMVEQMWHAYEHRKECEEKGWQGYQDVREMTWASSAQQLLAVLEESGVI